MEQQEKKSKGKDAIYIIIIILLICFGGYMAFQMGNVKKSLANCGMENTTLQQEKDDLNQILVSSGIVDNADNKEVKANLEAMLLEYGNIESTNVDMQDSIAKQKSKIQGLLSQVDSLENLSAAEKKKAWGQIYKLKKETETLRSIMKGYIHTIDSLNTLNIGLKNTIVEKDNQISSINDNLNQVTDKNKELQNTVAKGSKLQTTNLTAGAIKIKKSGAQTETSRASRTDQIKACFTIIENTIAKAENKTLYMRILDPNAKEIIGDSPITFNMGGKDGQACIARKINYQNQNTDVCIYFELENEIVQGTYIVEIFCEGHQIGKTSFALKK